MPKFISQNDIYTIQNLLSGRPDGFRIGEIETLLKLQGINLNRRTLQRRLIQLKQNGKIITSGLGRATRYIAVSDEKYVFNDNDKDIFLSEDAKVVINEISKPVSTRKPVSYHRKFIDDYKPNKTFYLSKKIRNHLMNKGRRMSVDYKAGTYIKKILNRLLIDLSWASSHLEGNTYSILETEKLIEFGELPPGKTHFETQMILNHKTAIEFLVESANETGFNRRTIFNLHAILSDNLLGNPAASGRLRAIPVGIGKSVYEPLAIPQLIDELFGQLLNTASEISDPFEQSFFIFLHLPYLQPFEDVNKRVSRLAANIPFIRNNLCPLSFMDVPEDLYFNGLLGVYELNDIALIRDVFVWTYERSCNRYQVIQHSLGEPDIFRLRYRQALIECVGEAIRQVCYGKTINTGEVISNIAKDIVPENDRNHFLEVAKEEIEALHEGNYARYQIRFSEFMKWQKLTH